MQTNESLKTWTHVDDNDLTNALLMAQKKTHSRALFLAWTRALISMRKALLQTRAY